MQTKSFKKESFNNVTIIVQPLKALMEESVSKLSSHGFRAIHLGTGCDDVVEILHGKYNYYPLFKSEEMTRRIKLLVVDESHCYRKWYVHIYYIHQIASVGYYGLRMSKSNWQPRAFFDFS